MISLVDSPDGAREVAADPRGQAHAGVGARGELRPIQGAESRVLPVQVGAAVGAQEGICDPDLKDAEPRGALQVHRLAYVKLEVLVASRRPLPAIYPDRRHSFFPSTEPPACWAGHAGGGVRRVCGDLLRPGLRLLPLLLHPGRLGRVVDVRVGGGGGAAANVLALALEQRAAAQELAEDRPQELPHRRSSRRSLKKYIEETMKVPVDREQTYFEEWDEPALRQIIRQQRKITETSKQLKMRSLFQILIVIDDFADNPHLRKRSGDSALDTLFVRGRHFQISTLVSTQKLRLVSNAVRVNSQFFCIWRLRNQLEKDSLLEELTALVPKPQLEAMYEAAVAEPYSFLFIYLLNPLEKMFHIRFERVFQLGRQPSSTLMLGLNM